MTEAMNKYTAPKVERPSFFSRLIGRYAMFRYMPPMLEGEQEEVDLEAFAEEIEVCAQASVPQVIKDLESDGNTGVDDAEVLRIARCIVLDDLRTLADESDSFPSNFRRVRAVGNVVNRTLSDAYNPTPDSGRREAFDKELQAIDDAVREELAASEHIRLG